MRLVKGDQRWPFSREAAEWDMFRQRLWLCSLPEDSGLRIWIIILNTTETVTHEQGVISMGCQLDFLAFKCCSHNSLCGIFLGPIWKWAHDAAHLRETQCELDE